MTNKELKKKIEEILNKPANRLLECPYCDFKPTSYISKKGKWAGVSTHIWRVHRDKEPAKVDELLSLCKEYALSVLPGEMTKRGITDGSDESWNLRAFSFNQAIKQAKENIK